MIMAKPSSYPGFTKLLTDWNQKLAESGFRDAEEWRGGDYHLKKTGTMVRFEKINPIVRDAKAKYFEIVGKKILETHFDDEQEKQIMYLHFEGFTQEEIKTRLDPPTHRVTVYRKLYKWLKRWGLK